MLKHYFTRMYSTVLPCVQLPFPNIHYYQIVLMSILSLSFLSITMAFIWPLPSRTTSVIIKMFQLSFCVFVCAFHFFGMSFPLSFPIFFNNKVNHLSQLAA